MADDLKRVGIKLTAEGARDFKSELKECTAATKENYSELKLAQSQYDKNTSSTKKLEDRQKYLASQTDAYRDKVKILNGQLADMEQAENRDETAIAKKRAELNQAEAKLNDYEKSLESVNKQLENHSGQLKDWGGKLQNVGGKMQSVGKGLTAGVTAPILGVGAASVKAFTEVDEAMDTMIQKTGATGKQAKDLENIVKNLAHEIPTDFNTAASAVGEVQTRFGLTGKALEDLSGQFVKFAQLNNTDVSQSIDGVQKALTAYGLEAKDAGGFLDQLNKTGQDTGISVDKLADGIVTNAASFKQMGLNIDQAVTFMGALEKSGANSETVLNGMRKALKNATDSGVPLNQALSDLQNTILNGTGSMDGLNASYKLFGKSGDQIYNAVKSGSIDFQDLANSMGQAGDATGNVSKTFEETKDPLDEIKTIMNDLKALGYDIITTSGPMITEVLGKVRDIVKDLSEKWNNLDDGQKEFIIKAALVAAAVGPIIAVIGSVVGGIGTLLLALSALGVGLAPLLIGGAIIAGVVAGAVLLVKNWDKVKAGAGKVKEGVAKSWGDLKASTKQAVDGMVTSWNDFKSKAGQKIGDMVTGAKQKWSDLKTNTAQTFDNVKQAVGDKLGKAKQFAKDRFADIKGFAKFTWHLPKMGLDAVTSIPGKVKDIVGRIKDIFDFDISFPKIKLPHFKWHWEDIGGILSIPHFDGISWYKKAYQRAAYYTSPTVRPDGRGYGDGTGGEFAVGERHLRDVVREESRNSNVTINITINGAAGQNEEKLAQVVADKIRKEFERDQVVWA